MSNQGDVIKKVDFQKTWPEGWKVSYGFDLIEIYGLNNRCGHFFSYTTRMGKVLDLIQQVIPPNAKVLDIAAAQGNYSLSLAELGYDVTWNDIRSELADYVKLKYEHGTIHFAPGNILEIDFNHSYDLCLMGEIVEHVAYPDRLLKRVIQLIKPGGYIIMTTPNGSYFRSRGHRFSKCLNPSKFENTQFKSDADGHIFLLHLDEIYSLAQTIGLRVVKTLLINNCLTNGDMRLGWLLKFLPSAVVKTIEQFTQGLPFSIQEKLNSCIIVLFKRLEGCDKLEKGVREEPWPKKSF